MEDFAAIVLTAKTEDLRRAVLALKSLSKQGDATEREMKAAFQRMEKATEEYNKAVKNAAAAQKNEQAGVVTNTVASNNQVIASNRKVATAAAKDARDRVETERSLLMAQQKADRLAMEAAKRLAATEQATTVVVRREVKAKTDAKKQIAAVEKAVTDTAQVEAQKRASIGAKELADELNARRAAKKEKVSVTREEMAAVKSAAKEQIVDRRKVLAEEKAIAKQELEALRAATAARKTALSEEKRSVAESVRAARTRATEIERAAKAEARAIADATRAQTRQSEQLAKNAAKDAQARQRQIGSLQRLKASLDPAEAATQEYNRTLSQLNRAVSAGIIPQTEANRLLALTTQRYHAAEQASNLFTLSTFRVSNMSRIGRANIQQFSYQLQDVAIQLQAGQDAMIIFAQQGSQIASLFGPHGAILGVVLSVAAAVATLFVPSLMQGKTALEKIQDAMSDFTTTAADVVASNNLLKMSQVELIEKFGGTADAIREVIGLMQVVQSDALMKKARGVLEGVRDAIAPETDGIQGLDLATLFGLDSNFVFAFTDAGRAIRKEARSMVFDVNNSFAAFDAASTVEEQLDAANKLFVAFKTAAQASGDINDQESQVLLTLGEIIKELAEVAVSAPATVDALLISAEKAQRLLAYKKLYFDQLVKNAELAHAKEVEAATEASQRLLTSKKLYFGQVVKSAELAHAKEIEAATEASQRLSADKKLYFNQLVRDAELAHAKEIEAATEASQQLLSYKKLYFNQLVRDAELAHTKEIEAATEASQQLLSYKKLYFDQLVRDAELAHAKEIEAATEASQQLLANKKLYFNQLVRDAELVHTKEIEAATEASQQLLANKKLYFNQLVRDAELAHAKEIEAATEASQQLLANKKLYFNQLVRDAELTHAKEIEVATEASQRLLANKKLYFNQLVRDAELKRVKEVEAAEKAAEESKRSRKQFFDEAVRGGESEYNASLRLLNTYNEQLEIVKLIGQYGQDHIQVLDAQWAIEERSLRVELERKNTVKSVADQIVQAARETFYLQNNSEGAAEALARGANAAAQLRDALVSANSSISTLGQDVEQKIAVIRARTNALRTGLDEGIAGEIQALKNRRDEIVKGLVAEGASIDQIAEKTAATEQLIATYQKDLVTHEQVAEAMRESAAATGASGAASTAAAKLAAEAAKKALDAAVAYTEGLRDIVKSSVGDFVDQMVEGFKGGTRSVMRLLEDTFKNMAAYALKNKIEIALGMRMTPAQIASGATQGVPGTGGGMLGAVGKGLNSIGTGFWGGLSGVGDAFLSGGFGGATSAIGTALKGTTSGLAGFAGALGAIAGPLMAVSFLVSAFKVKTTQLTSGLSISVKDLSVAVDQYSSEQKSTLFGLIKKTTSTSGVASDDISSPISRAIGDMQKDIIEAAKVLDFSSGVFNDFAHSLNVSTKGLSKDDALEAIQNALLGVGDAFAGMVPGLAALQNEGEGAMDAIKRLSSELTAVNHVIDTLGVGIAFVGLSGAAMASDLVKAFGSIEALTSASNSYYEKFYDEQQRMAIATRQTTETLGKLGVVMPTTRDQYKALVDAQDLSTESGRKLFAALVQMADVMDFVLPTVGALTDELMALIGSVDGHLGDMPKASEVAQNAAERAASGWYSAAQNLRDYIADLRGAKSDLVSAETTRAYNESRFQVLLAQALAGSQSAYKNLTGAADALLNSTTDTARTSVEAAIQQARIIADLNKAANVADLSGAKNDVVAGLLSDQSELLTSIKDYLASGGVLNPDDIDALNAQLGSLQGAISDVQALDYATIVANMGITATLVSQVPDETLRTLLQNEHEALERDINFFANTEGLTPSQLLLAFDAASTTDRTIKFLANNTQVTGTNAELALQVSGEAIRTIKATLQTSMTEKDKDLALAVSGGITRSVEAVLKSNLKSPAVELALQTNKGILRNVNAIIKPGRLDSDGVRLGLAVASNILHTVDAALVAGRVSSYGVRVALAEAKKISHKVDAVLPGERIKSWGVRVALAESGVVDKKVNALLGDENVIDALKLALAESDEIKKKVVGEVDISKLSLEEKALLAALGTSTPGSLVLGGSFLWDPSTGFQTWLEQTTEGNIADPLNALVAPMALLRASLTDLTTELRIQNAADDAARAEVIAEAARAKALADANAAGAKLLADRGAAVGTVSGLVNKINEFDAKTAGNLVLNDGTRTSPSMNADGSLDFELPAGFGGGYTSSSLAAWKAFYQGPIVDGHYTGAQYQLLQANREREAIDRALEAARQQVTDLGGVPGFARGGNHSGGLRFVGEEGIELEATGPARYYSARDTARMVGGDNSELIAEIRKLRREVKELKDQDHEFSSKDAILQRRMSKLMESWDVDGLYTRT